MGKPKALLEWEGSVLVEYQVRQLRQAGADPVIVVLGDRASGVRPLAEVAGAMTVLNARYMEGRASSVRAGAAAVPDDTDAIIILSVDEPRPSHVLKRLVSEHASSGAAITLPTHGGKRGHPPVFTSTLLPELRAVTEKTRGLREVVERHLEEAHVVEFETPIVLLGMNTIEEYEEAQFQYGEWARE